MGWFPWFVQLSGVRGLVIGGGGVALRRVRSLLPYGPELTVVSPAFREELRAIPGLRLVERPWEAGDITEEYAFVVAASDSGQVNKRAALRCRELGIPVNVADDLQACTFLFPALVRRGALTAGISTGGASPAAAAYVRQALEDALPPELEEILDYLQARRAAWREAVPSPQGRRALHRALFAACMERGRPLTPEEERPILKMYQNM